MLFVGVFRTMLVRFFSCFQGFLAKTKASCLGNWLRAWVFEILLFGGLTRRHSPQNGRCCLEWNLLDSLRLALNPHPPRLSGRRAVRCLAM